MIAKILERNPADHAVKHNRMGTVQHCANDEKFKYFFDAIDYNYARTLPRIIIEHAMAKVNIVP